MRQISLPALATLLFGNFIAVPALAQEAKDEVVKPKVMVISMFADEAKPWLENEELTEKIAVPGLFEEFPEVACSAEGLCHLTTGMGYANAASSVSAILYSNLFDLTETYFLVAGIGGVDPEDGTLGSAHWARFVVDAGLKHEIDARQMPEDWPTGYLGLGADKPGEKAKWKAGTEVFRLNEALLQKAFALSRNTELLDGNEAAAYRATYGAAPANGNPIISICDTMSGNTYWHGEKIAAAMGAWTELLTDGEGNYCTTQMEDNATLTALKRGTQAGLIDFDRVAVLRTGSNFDREAPGQAAIESLRAKSGGFMLATTNAYRVGSKLTKAIIADWQNWRADVPHP
jgi:purine nucleoside permease